MSATDVTAVQNTLAREQAAIFAGETRDKLGWYPTPEAFQAYLDREVEMASANLKKGFSADVTLHSYRTITLALAGQPSK